MLAADIARGLADVDGIAAMVRQRVGTCFGLDVAGPYPDVAGRLWPPGDDRMPLLECSPAIFVFQP